MKIYSCQDKITYIFNRNNTYFFITEKNSVYCIKNDIIQHVCKGNRHLSPGWKTIVDGKNTFTLYYATHYQRHEDDYYISIRRNGMLAAKGKSKTNYGKREPSVKLLHPGSSFNNQYLVLFSTWDITKNILKQSYNKDIDDFYGLIVIEKSIHKITKIPMPAAVRFTALSEDNCTLAAVIDKEIYLIDLE